MRERERERERELKKNELKIRRKRWKIMRTIIMQNSMRTKLFERSKKRRKGEGGRKNDKKI